MGRVKRYKKIKSCDPFAKVKRSEDTFHDEPPEEFEDRRKKSKKRNSLDWDDDEDKELLLQREAMRTIKLDQKPQKKVKEIEPKKENETPKQFKARLRQDTRMTLYEELHKLTASSKRRKEKMIERKKKKKMGKNVAPSDGQDDPVLEFKSCEPVPFGATNLRPPELKSFTEKLTARMKSKASQRALIAPNHSPQDNEDPDAVENSDEAVVEEEEEKKKRKGKKVKLIDRDDLFGDDGLELSSAAERNHWNLPIPGSKKSKNSGSGSVGVGGGGGGARIKGQTLSGSSKSSNTKSSIPTGHSDSVSSGNNNDKQMELMRKRVMEAYAKIRERRRSTSAAYQT